MLKNKSYFKAFSLIELSVCVLILAILTAIAIPLYLEHLEEAKGSKALENLSLIRSAEMLYQPENGGFTANVAELQTYTNFSLNDGDWVYAITSTGAGDFLAIATRTSANVYNGRTITINHDSDIIINGIRVVNGGSWP